MGRRRGKMLTEVTVYGDTTQKKYLAVSEKGVSE